MSALDWLKLDVAKYLSDTTHLSTALHGAYLLLIMHYWSRRGLPEDDEQLAAITRMSRTDWRRAKPVLQAFFYDGWRHSHLDAELIDAAERYARRAGAGKAGGIAAALLRNKHESVLPCEFQPNGCVEVAKNGNASSNATEISGNDDSIASSNASSIVRGGVTLVPKDITSLSSTNPNRAKSLDREARAILEAAKSRSAADPPTLSPELAAKVLP